MISAFGALNGWTLLTARDLTGSIPRWAGSRRCSVACRARRGGRAIGLVAGW
jgi:hypothetical protein